MVGADVKRETKRLMEKRESIESEMNVILDRLFQPGGGGPGLSGNLVDSEGFPRSDIDIPAVRTDRLRLSQLKNDHKDLTEKINQNIQLLHAAKPGPKFSTILVSENNMKMDGQVSSISDGSGHTSSELVCMRNTASCDDSEAIVAVPFAMIDEIAESSPAAEDGLQLGDQILKFGSVISGENMLSRLTSEVQMNQDSAISVVVMRQGARMSASVTPRTWKGRGLLGCHFKIL